ncbi:MAG: luciferase family oxidoreductase group 1 [Verrucomicrobiales bacterium]|jgi:luciferase family oxidoreductase group 1
MTRLPLSVLDLALVPHGSTSTEALLATTQLAQRSDALGFTRFWVAEHHNMSAVASAAPSVLIAHLAASTERISIGSGGVMLPNHAPFVIAEQFAMLEALHPGRIDLGIGRAPGTDRNTMVALRQNMNPINVDEFPQHVIDVMGLLGDARTKDGMYTQVRATPNATSRPTVALLGSSGYSAQLAGMLGVPFGFAHHFGMGGTSEAADIYRQHFTPSPVLDEPHLIVTAVAVAAETAVEADHILASHRLFKHGLRTGRLYGVFDADEAASHPDYPAAAAGGTNAIYGTGEDVVDGLEKLSIEMGATELMITIPVADVEQRLASLEITARAWFGGV